MPVVVHFPREPQTGTELGLGIAAVISLESPAFFICIADPGRTGDLYIVHEVIHTI